MVTKNGLYQSTFGSKRLGDVSICPLFKPPKEIHLRILGRAKYDRNLFGDRIFFESATDLVTIQLRHNDIQNNHIRITVFHLSLKLLSHYKEILAWIAKGAKNREIVQSLCISEKTVKNHVTSILHRLNLRDRTQAAIFACSKLEGQTTNLWEQEAAH